MDKGLQHAQVLGLGGGRIQTYDCKIIKQTAII